MNTVTFKVGVLDHHKLVGTMPRSTFTKAKPKKIFYGCYKNFDNETFEEKLKRNFYLQSKILKRSTLHLKQLKTDLYV